MVTNSSRLAHLLGEMRRQMNGAVVGGMRFYGEEYGLNYGVSIATIRAIARDEVGDYERETNHRFAKLLYQQEVRELRLAALYLADSEAIATPDDIAFWAKGIINTEVAEEAAFALLSRCPMADKWLEENSELLQYTALMAISRNSEINIDTYRERITALLSSEVHIIPSAVVALLDSAIRQNTDKADIQRFIADLPECGAKVFISDEIAWRLE